ncbi:hypothetical protein D3C78_1746330 [compost metagenome]
MRHVRFECRLLHDLHAQAHGLGELLDIVGVGQVIRIDPRRRVRIGIAQTYRAA